LSGNEMVVNLHVTERCNFRCAYCFGQWGLLAEGARERSMFADTAQATDLMTSLWSKFSRDRAVRFNFVGGEPALLPNIAELFAVARSLGARTSYVTNGLMLRRFDAAWTVDNVDVVGVSIDSALASTNQLVGRVGANGKTFDLDEVTAAIHRIREIGSPRVKINTVVSAWNAGEDFTGMVRALNPDRWKVLKMLPVYTDAGAIDDAAFDVFLDRHAAFEHIIVAEDNDQMSGSYAMIDPQARFFWFDGEAGSGYAYSAAIHEAGLDAAWGLVPFDEAKFAERYVRS
jgi:radical S-adenosyl methionine domain-containing protein 2